MSYTLDSTDYDAIFIGTSLPQLMLAASLARIGRKVVIMDTLTNYGGAQASLPLHELHGLLAATADAATNTASTGGSGAAAFSAAVAKWRATHSDPAFAAGATVFPFANSAFLSASDPSDAGDSSGGSCGLGGRGAGSQSPLDSEYTTSLRALLSDPDNAAAFPFAGASVWAPSVSAVTAAAAAAPAAGAAPADAVTARSSDSTAVDAPAVSAADLLANNNSGSSSSSSSNSDATTAATATTTATVTTASSLPPPSADMLKQRFRFSLDLSPALVLSRCALVDILVRTDTASYLEFKGVEDTYMALSQAALDAKQPPVPANNNSTNNISSSSITTAAASGSVRFATPTGVALDAFYWRTPCSKGDIFAEKRLSLIAKHSLTTLAHVLNHDPRNPQTKPAHVAQYAAFASRPLSALLADAKAPALARAMFAYALGHGMGEPTVAAAAAAAANVLLASKSPATATAAAISAANDASVGELLTKDAARRTKGIMTSLGRFGQKGAHLYPSYGISELAQAFARLTSVFGTICMLQHAPVGFVFTDSIADANTTSAAAAASGNNPGLVITGVLTPAGQYITAKRVYVDKMHLPSTTCGTREGTRDGTCGAVGGLAAVPHSARALSLTEARIQALAAIAAITAAAACNSTDTDANTDANAHGSESAVAAKQDESGSSASASASAVTTGTGTGTATAPATVAASARASAAADVAESESAADGGACTLRTALIARAIVIAEATTPLHDLSASGSTQIPGLSRLVVHPDAFTYSADSDSNSDRKSVSVSDSEFKPSAHVLFLDSNVGVCPTGFRVANISLPLLTTTTTATASDSAAANPVANAVSVFTPSAEDALGPLVSRLFDTSAVTAPAHFSQSNTATAAGGKSEKPKAAYVAFFTQRVTVSSTGELATALTVPCTDADAATAAADAKAALAISSLSPLLSSSLRTVPVEGLVCVPDPWMWEADAADVAAQAETLFWRHIARCPAGVHHPSPAAIAAAGSNGADVTAEARTIRQQEEVEFFKLRRADGKVYDVFGNVIDDDELNGIPADTATDADADTNTENDSNSNTGDRCIAGKSTGAAEVSTEPEAAAASAVATEIEAAPEPETATAAEADADAGAEAEAEAEADVEADAVFDGAAESNDAYVTHDTNAAADE